MKTITMSFVVFPITICPNERLHCRICSSAFGYCGNGWTVSKSEINHFFASLSAQNNTLLFSSSAAFLFLCTKKAHFELCSVLWCCSPPSSLLSSLSLSLPLALPLWVSLLLHLLSLSLLLNMFLQSKHFHLRYGWLFNAVSPSELAEAWCSACFCGAQMDLPKNTRTCSPTPCCTTPHQALSYLLGMSCFLSLSKYLHSSLFYGETPTWQSCFFGSCVFKLYHFYFK